MRRRHSVSCSHRVLDVESTRSKILYCAPQEAASRRDRELEGELHGKAYLGALPGWHEAGRLEREARHDGVCVVQLEDVEVVELHPRA